ncbi:uncharacterized protein BO88DRAFT_349124 [Aspergillus vadensis CBS 113365]|uniref:Uncharacterized protein n=1 Tax=Aspergillus vadensis (strain CBS 113365 / IMI 142717 / IBT 24658) TaxID=1448311 RepID=A0A319C934_ASPVC|nr:hypothetical protein BO88DRAFT_349124 [Aspergillus vadensis CBS 113365]PYH65242.1 hypothetical protein BO88DRAFT_349124 [Aspergillus vadensis CBS 113365]
MSQKVEPPARRQMRAALRDLALKIKSLAVDELDLQQLENLNVRVDLMSLDQASPHKPSYFAPLADHSIPDPKDDDLHGPYNGVDDETEPAFTSPVDRAYAMDIHLSSYITYYSMKADHEGYRTTCVGDSAFEKSSLYKYEQPEFGCYRIAELNGPTRPHVKAVMYNNLVATDSTILFGELMPILRIMLTQLRRRKFIHEMVSPVLIFSLMGLQARVIEAFFQDQNLVLRPTKMYDFSHGNSDAFKSLAQWYILGEPIGDTTKAS